MSRLMIVLIVLLSLAVAGLFLVKHKNASLRASLDRANSVASGQQTIITMLKNQLHVALTRAEKNELAQVALRQELENAAKREAQREKTITRLLNENEDFRRWYGADLPGTVLTCLMLCAGCTSVRPAPTPVIVANACPKVSLCPMPGSDPQTNGDLSADIRQLENALARCASQVKMIKHCQDENDAQTRQPAQGAD